MKKLCDTTTFPGERKEDVCANIHSEASKRNSDFFRFFLPRSFTFQPEYLIIILSNKQKGVIK